MAITPEEATITLSATTQDVGGASEAIHVQAEGQEVEIAFSASFLVEGLNAATTDTMTLEISSPLKPGVLKSTGEESFSYILMPVRIG